MKILKKEGRLLVTPHSAVPASMIERLLGNRIRANIQRLVDGGEVKGEEDGEGGLGSEDAEKGY